MEGVAPGVPTLLTAIGATFAPGFKLLLFPLANVPELLLSPFIPSCCKLAVEGKEDAAMSRMSKFSSWTRKTYRDCIQIYIFAEYRSEMSRIQPSAAIRQGCIIS